MTSATGTSDTRSFDDYVLDENTLAELASIICGDDGPYHRAGWQLVQLLRNTGWHGIDEYDRAPRRQWMLEHLRARKQQHGAIGALVRRLADSREYIDEPTAAEDTIQQLNELLSHEGFRVRAVRGRGEIVDAIAADGPEQQAPVELTTTIAALVSDPAAAKALQRRLDETLACQEGAAYLSAIIMMGSLLEGVLIEVHKQRGTLGPKGARTSLEQLIDEAHHHGYIQADVQKFGHTLRGFRNFVHVHRQMAEGDTPDRDTTRVCWWVVVAALNDLAQSAS